MPVTRNSLNVGVSIILSLLPFWYTEGKKNLSLSYHQTIHSRLRANWCTRRHLKDYINLSKSPRSGTQIGSTCISLMVSFHWGRTMRQIYLLLILPYYISSEIYRFLWLRDSWVNWWMYELNPPFYYQKKVAWGLVCSSRTFRISHNAWRVVE